MAGPAPHTQLDADLAGGMGMPVNGPKLMSISRGTVAWSNQGEWKQIWMQRLAKELGVVIPVSFFEEA